MGRRSPGCPAPVQLSAQPRVTAIQRGREATQFFDRPTDQLWADCLRWGGEVVEGGLGGLPGRGDLRDPLGDDGRVGAGQPGDLGLDPMCGIGTTLVEAIHLGRHAMGVELEPRWADLARANTTHARAHGAQGTATVVTGDARHLPDLVDAELVGRVELVLTSPPYGSSIHGQVTARPGRGVAKYDNTYSPDPANLGRVNQAILLDALGVILGGCLALLRPGGLLVLSARPYRHRERLVDLPGQLTQVAEQAGLVLYERNAALLIGLRGERLVPRPSFFQLDRARKARARGLPLRIIAHEDVLVFRRPLSPQLLGTDAEMPGRYAHNPDPRLAELLHHVTVEGWGNDSVGDLDEDGFHTSLLIVEHAEQQELTDAFDRDIPVGNWVLTEDQQGFVTVGQYPTPAAARHAFKHLPDLDGPGDEDGTITPAGPLGSRYAVALGGSFLGYADDLDQATAMLRQAMDADRCWPDAWFISDHGHSHRLNLWPP